MCIGVIGERPTSWTAGTGTTLDFTLVRVATVMGPNAVFTASEWEAKAKDTTSFLGSHTMGSVE